MRTYGAIVVGSGISGGLAAKDVTEKGLITLMLGELFRKMCVSPLNMLVGRFSMDFQNFDPFIVL